MIEEAKVNGEDWDVLIYFKGDFRIKYMPKVLKKIKVMKNENRK